MSQNRPMAAWSAVLLTRMYRYKSLLKRKWWILAVTTSIAVCYQSYQIATESPVYQSTARMMVRIRISIPEGSVYAEEGGNFYQTQIELMKCGIVQSRTLQRIKTLRPELVPSPVSFNVVIAPKTSIFVLTATGADPKYTQAYLDSVMVEYMNLKREMRAQTSETTLAAITEQLGKLERELRQGEEELFEFQKNNNIVFLEEQGNSAGSYLVSLNDQIASAKLEYQLLDAMTKSAYPAGLQSVMPSNVSTNSPSVAGAPVLNLVENSDLSEGRKRIRVMKSELEELLHKVRPEHPKAVKLKEDIAQMERLVTLYEQENREQLESRKEGLQIKIKNLEQATDTWEVKALDLNRKMADYHRIKAKLTRMQSLHERLLLSMQHVDVNKNIDQEVLSIMEPASPGSFARFAPYRRILSSASTGLLIGLLILLLIDRVDDRINSLSELRDHFEERVLGQIPLESTNGGKNSILLIHGGRHLYTESFRNIRSSLFFMETDGIRPKCILITSASPGEGKSTIAANLAVTMAEAGSRVLLIDGDLRRGVMHHFFKLPPSPGYSDILSQRVRWNDAVVTYSRPGLSIIPRGSLVQNPGELFLSSVTDLMLREIRQIYDCVIFDSAPVLAADDTPSLAPKMDGVLFVLSASLTSGRLAKNSLDLLYDRQVSILGLIFNRLDTSLPEYYYYQYNSYDPSQHEKPADRAPGESTTGGLV